MDGLFFLGAIAGIVLLMLWVAQNDKIGTDKPTKGLFAMREAALQGDAKDGQGKNRPAGGPAGPGKTQAAAARRPGSVR